MSIVLRIVTNIKADNIDAAEQFYRDVFGLTLLMDQGWIQTYGSTAQAPVQISVATQGGSDTPVPDISIEVDDLQQILKRITAADIPVIYGPAKEPWGVERFYVKDPFGKVLNVMQHLP
ncbi:MAG: VOC family protein [Pseudomonadota bacterium]